MPFPFFESGTCSALEEGLVINSQVFEVTLAPAVVRSSSADCCYLWLLGTPGVWKNARGLFATPVRCLREL